MMRVVDILTGIPSLIYMILIMMFLFKDPMQIRLIFLEIVMLMLLLI